MPETTFDVTVKIADLDEVSTLLKEYDYLLQMGKAFIKHGEPSLELIGCAVVRLFQKHRLARAEQERRERNAGRAGSIPRMPNPLDCQGVEPETGKGKVSLLKDNDVEIN